MIAWFGGHVETAEILLALGVLAYVVDRIGQAKGWSHNAKTLREENLDLLRRNEELVGKIERLEHADTEKTAQLATMAQQIAELKERDQLAVIQRLDMHEEAASARHTATIGVLTDIADYLKGGEIR